MSTNKTRSARAPATVLAALLTALTFTTPVVAGPSAQHIGAASSHAVAASAHIGSAGIKGVSAVAAIPLITVGVSGVASAAAGSALYEFANEPLRIGHEVIHKAPQQRTQKSTQTPSPAEQMAETARGEKP